KGFGRMALTAGRLAVINHNVCDVHRFCFETLGKLAEQGAKLVAESVTLIARFPDVVQA
ncbi:MAG: nitrogen fixation protein, partial [Rhodospirillaceae bacterium]